jgi:AcrR family transcriptional regulator
MDDVAAAAGVGKGTLFRAFGSRDGLLDALWLHGVLQDLIEQAEPEAAVADDWYASYTAHVLLGTLRIDLIDELLATGLTPQQIRSAQATMARRILGRTP